MKQYFKYYSHNYPKNEIRDFLKLLKQICSGPGHFLESESKSLEFLLSEAQALPKVRKHENLYDRTQLREVNLRPFIKLGLNLEAECGLLPFRSFGQQFPLRMLCLSLQFWKNSFQGNL